MKYLVEYRTSHPTREEVLALLKVHFFDKVTCFETDGGLKFLIETAQTQLEISEWIEDNLPYSLRDLTSGYDSLVE